VCLAVFAIDVHPHFRLVVASNRDEYHDRPAEPAHWWPSGILAGRDRRAGGTWLGVTARGRWAVVTNFREGVRAPPGAPSRGALVVNALADPRPTAAAVTAATAALDTHPGCNLVIGDVDHAQYVSNRAVESPLVLPAGIQGLSNGPLHARWPKVRRLEEAMARWAAAGATAFDKLFDSLRDDARAPDDELPSTGVSLELERVLSSPFIVGDHYGTRASTILAVDRRGACTLWERRFGPGGVASGESRFDYALAPG
jgi:uncharacterized protein with NRDE domain